MASPSTEGNDFNVINSLTFTGSINSQNAINWSGNNKIALCTEQGIHILSSHSSPSEALSPFSIHKQFIACPQKPQKLEFPVNRADLHLHLPKDQLFEMMMDHTVSPKIAGPSPFTIFRSAIWSPVGAAGFKRCLLATLTNDHAVNLYEDLNNNWVMVADLTELLLNHCKTMFPQTEFGSSNEQEALNNYYALRDEIYKMAANVMVWTHIFDKDISSLGKWCYLIVGSKSGHFILWRVIFGRELKVEIAGEWKGSIVNPKSLYWQPTGRSSGFLVIGCHSGEVLLLCITESTSETRRSCPLISANLYLWKDRDKVIPTCLQVLKQARNRFVVVFTKGRFLGTCEIVIANLEMKVQKVSCVAGLHSLPATGLMAVDGETPQRRFMVTSMDGRTVRVTIHPTETALVLKQEEIKLSADNPKLCPQGIATSPNHTLHLIAYNTTPLFDHLVRRDPILLIIFTLDKMDDVMSKLESQLSGNVLIPFANHYSDILDCLVSLWTSETKPFAFLIELINSNWEYQSICKLQLIRFLLKASQNGLIFLGSEIENIPEKVKKLEMLMVKNHCLKICTTTLSRLEKLTKLQKLSLRLMSDWLQSSYKVKVSEFDLEEIFDATKERCNICQEAIAFEHIFKASCPTGHKFARCCHSLLVIDSRSYVKCVACNTLALRENIWYLKPHCTLCGTLMT